MKELAAAAPTAQNPRLALLPGYVDLDLARTAREDKRNDEALAAIDRACQLGEHWEFLAERARIQVARGKLDEALKDVEAAERLRPGHPEALERLVSVLVARQDWQAAAIAIRQLIRVRPTDDTTRRRKPEVIAGLMAKADELAATEPARALDLLDLAISLAPRDRQLHSRRSEVILPQGPLDDAKIQELEKAIADRPDDFHAVQRLDYVRVKKKELERVVKLWNAYLERNPKDGRAYLERGGTFSQLRKRTESEADLRRACELGVSHGCALTGFRPYPAQKEK